MFVLTHSGPLVIDVARESIVAEDLDASFPSDPHPIRADGIGPLAGQQVSLAGLWGGGLRTYAPDGWVVHRIAPNWPLDCLVLCPPDAPEIEQHVTATMLIKDTAPELRAFGFSDTGKSFVAADTLLYLWRRD